MGLCEKFNGACGEKLYVLSRLIVGLLFFLHGWGKFSGGTPSGVMLIAAVVEVVVGLGLFLGFYTRLVASLGATQMLVAYLWKHAPNMVSPLAQGGGELALLFFAAFVPFIMYGAKNWSLEQALLKKETF